MTKENNKVDINKHEIDINTLFKQNVNDLCSIKELYNRIEELGEKITQVKYIDNTLVKKLKKEYENLKKLILDENIQVKLTNDIEKINSELVTITQEVEKIKNINLDEDELAKLTRQPFNVKKVSLDGTCDYTSISSAVDNANSEIVIQVMPGVYDNIVKGFGKDISIIGVDKKRCILKNTTGDYKTPPLEMTHGYLANMTIYAEKLEGATIPSMLTYAIHIDRSGSRNKTLLIENCDFYSDWNACAGIGTWANFTLTFRNCNFYMNNPTQTNGAIFFHNASVEGELNQNIIFDNCRIYSKSDIGIYIGDALTNGNSPLNATFINTLVYSSTKGKDCIRRTSGSKWSGNNISLTGDSYGNNITILNA